MLEYTKLIEEIASEIAVKSKVSGNKQKIPAKIYINMEFYRAYIDYRSFMNIPTSDAYGNFKLMDIPCEIRADQTEPFVIEYADITVVGNQNIIFS
jgi:hypothetical protein